jgi:hypothetical protein
MAAAKEKVDQSTGEVIEETPGTDLVAGAPGTALAVTDEWDYGNDAGLGTENQTAEDVSVPFFIVLQPGSPKVQQPDATVKAGQIINNTTDDVYGDAKTGMTFIPSYTEHTFLEFIPRDNGGGLVGMHAIDSDLIKQVRESQPLGKYVHPDNKNDLIETFTVYGVAVDRDGNGVPAVMGFQSTHIKPYKDWMFRARSIVLTNPKTGAKITAKQMPLWAFAYSIRTVWTEKNGFKWYGISVGFAGKDAVDSRVPAGSALYELAKSVHEGVSTGRTKADTSSLTREETGDAAPQKGDVNAADAPY